MGINSISQSENVYFNHLNNENKYNTNLNQNDILFTSNKLNSDVFNDKTSLPKDGKDDGSIGFDSALSNMVKGVGNFVKGMFCDENGNFSVKQTLKTVGIGAAIGVTCAFLPAITIAGTTFSTMGLISAGFLGLSGLHFLDSVENVLNADTDANVEKAWQNVGSSLTETTLSFVGYKASGGIFAKDSVATAPTSSSNSKSTPKSKSHVQSASRTDLMIKESSQLEIKTPTDVSIIDKSNSDVALIDKLPVKYSNETSSSSKTYSTNTSSSTNNTRSTGSTKQNSSTNNTTRTTMDNSNISDKDKFISDVAMKISGRRGYNNLSIQERIRLADMLDMSPSELSKMSKAQYKKLIVQFHPDKGGSNEMSTIITNLYTTAKRYQNVA